MRTFSFDIQNIIDAQGLNLSITGMAIVFTALMLISIAITLLPKVLQLLAGILPAAGGHHGQPAAGGHHGQPAAAPAKPAVSAPATDDHAIVAAIGYVLHTRLQK